MKNYWTDKKKQRETPMTIDNWIKTGGPMGIGQLGNSEIKFIRKFRWMLHFEENGKIIVPQRFIKITRRPENTGFSPGELKVTYYGAEPCEPPELFNFLARVYDKEMLNVNAFLNLYDGCGNRMEEWLLSEVKIKSVNFGNPGYSSEPECDIELQIAYELCEYNNLCKTTQWAGF